MLEKLTYINHVNEKIVIDGSSGIFCNYNDLRDFAWSVSKKNDRISAFEKGVVSKKLPLFIKCATEAEGIATKNRIYEVMEKDVLALKHGKIVIGDYYLMCFVTGSKKTEYLRAKGYMKVDLTIQTDFPRWVKETSITFNKQTALGDYLDFPFDYPYDFLSEANTAKINNPAFVASDFHMIIYGYAASPIISIAGHEYNVECTIDTGEYLIIDSKQKTIMLNKADGTKENCFKYRNKTSYVFEQIPSGESAVLYDASLKFDIILLDERGEPKWT